MKKLIHEYVQSNREEIIGTLKELIEIPSVRAKAEEGAPFGNSCAEVLEHIERLYNENGFTTELDREGGYLLSYYGTGKRTLGIFAHADVVDVSNDWVYTEPFKPVEKDGFLIGRGAIDDKSAVVISLYCAKMLKELKIPFSSRLVTFIGSNEESGMADIGNYLSKHSAPAFALAADTAFPLYRGDKSGMNCWVTFNSELKDIKNFGGGTAMNIILGEASAEVNGEALTETGISKHSALPEGSINAGYLLAEKLSLRSDICEADKEQLRLVAEVARKYYGEAFGIEHEDECGRLTCTNCIIKTENGKIVLGLNLRFGISADSEHIRKRMREFFEKNDCTVAFEEEKRGYAVPADNKYIKACLKAYGDFTGEKEPNVYINAGGTYARKLPCAAETGTTTRWGRPEGMPAGHGGAHQPDECINIEGFLEAAELTLHMLLECDGERG